MPSSYRASIGISTDMAEKLLIHFPEMPSNPSAFVKQIIVDLADGKLIYRNSLMSAQELKNRLTEARLLDIQTNTKLKKLDIQMKLVHDFHVEPSIAVAVANGSKTLEEAGIIPTAMPTSSFQQMPISIFDESNNQFICSNCNPPAKFTFRLGLPTEMINASEEFVNHILNTHNRRLNQDESKVINEFLDAIQKGTK